MEEKDRFSTYGLGTDDQEAATLAQIRPRHCRLRPPDELRPAGRAIQTWAIKRYKRLSETGQQRSFDVG